jgi:cysteine desulfurase
MNPRYFDYNATTPVSAEVLSELVPVLSHDYGNASSVHIFGQAARRLLERSRERAAALLGASPRELVFTSGGTEADNLAVLGAVNTSGGRRPKHVVTTRVEHHAVLRSCLELERLGTEVTYLDVDANGLVTPDAVARALRPNTVLVSVMHANNETGVLQPIAEIAAVTRPAGVLLHSDGVQAAGKIPVNVRSLGVDLYSASGHKFYAPKGIGLLYVKQGTALAPLSFGGRHENGYRAGTENVPGAVALGAAAQWAQANLEAESRRLAELRDRLERGILASVPDTALNGASAPRLPNTTNIRFGGLQGESLLVALDLAGFAVSTGSACSSGAIEPSHVLLAMGLNREQSRSSLRFSVGRYTTAAEVDALVQAAAAAVAQLRRVAPAYAHV